MNKSIKNNLNERGYDPNQVKKALHANDKSITNIFDKVEKVLGKDLSDKVKAHILKEKIDKIKNYLEIDSNQEYVSKEKLNKILKNKNLLKVEHKLMSYACENSIPWIVKVSEIKDIHGIKNRLQIGVVTKNKEGKLVYYTVGDRLKTQIIDMNKVKIYGDRFYVVDIDNIE